MESTRAECILCCNLDKSKTNNTVEKDGSSMGKEERKRQVLGLLVETGMDLPPAVIFWNLKQQGATFERRSVDNYLSELREEHLVKKVGGNRGYYRATSDGRDEYLNR